MIRNQKLLLALCSILMVNTLWAGSLSVSDSLIGKLEKAEGTDRGILLIKICHEFSYTRPELMKSYAQQLVELGKETNDSVLVIVGYYDLGMSDYLQSNLPEAYQYFTDALKLAEQAKIDSLAIKSLNVLAVIQGRLGHYPKALDNFRKLASLSEKMKA